LSDAPIKDHILLKYKFQPKIPRSGLSARDQETLKKILIFISRLYFQDFSVFGVSFSLHLIALKFDVSESIASTSSLGPTLKYKHSPKRQIYVYGAMLGQVKSSTWIEVQNLKYFTIYFTHVES
jgi:hypothetical protein